MINQISRPHTGAIQHLEPNIWGRTKRGTGNNPILCVYLHGCLIHELFNIGTHFSRQSRQQLAHMVTSLACRLSRYLLADLWSGSYTYGRKGKQSSVDAEHLRAEPVVHDKMHVPASSVARLLGQFWELPGISLSTSKGDGEPFTYNGHIIGWDQLLIS